MKFLKFLFIILIAISSYATQEIPFDVKSYKNEFTFSGDSNYCSQKENSLTTSITGEYKINILNYDPYRPFDMFLSGKINHKYDFFGKILITDVFTTIEITF
jgi:hypothetical protein